MQRHDIFMDERDVWHVASGLCCVTGASAMEDLPFLQGTWQIMGWGPAAGGPDRWLSRSSEKSLGPCGLAA